MSTTCSRPAAEERYRQKNELSKQSVAVTAGNLKAIRPDIYREQVKKLRGSHNPDVEPHKLSIPDQASVVAGALRFFLQGGNVPSAPGITDDEYELPQTSHSTPSALDVQLFPRDPPFTPHLEGSQGSSNPYRPPNQNDTFTQDPYSITRVPQTSHRADSSQRPGQNNVFLTHSPMDLTSLSYPGIPPYVVPNTSGFYGFPGTQPVSNASQLDNDEGWLSFQKGGTWGTN